MSTLAVNVHRRIPQAFETDLDTDFERAKRIARLLDAEFEIAGFRFGLDPIIGLVPVVGDTVGFLAGLFPVHIVRKYKLGKWLERRMIANLLIEYVGGILPFAGPVFDAGFKANLRNAKLLEKAIVQYKRGVSGR